MNKIDKVTIIVILVICCILGCSITMNFSNEDQLCKNISNGVYNHTGVSYQLVNGTNYQYCCRYITGFTNDMSDYKSESECKYFRSDQ